LFVGQNRNSRARMDLPNATRRNVEQISVDGVVIERQRVANMQVKA
jgi:hypothetical protein